LSEESEPLVEFLDRTHLQVEPRSIGNAHVIKYFANHAEYTHFLVDVHPHDVLEVVVEDVARVLILQLFSLTFDHRLEILTRVVVQTDVCVLLVVLEHVLLEVEVGAPHLTAHLLPEVGLALLHRVLQQVILLHRPHHHAADAGGVGAFGLPVSQSGQHVPPAGDLGLQHLLLLLLDVHLECPLVDLGLEFLLGHSAQDLDEELASVFCLLFDEIPVVVQVMVVEKLLLCTVVFDCPFLEILPLSDALDLFQLVVLRVLV